MFLLKDLGVHTHTNKFTSDNYILHCVYGFHNNEEDEITFNAPSSLQHWKEPKKRKYFSTLPDEPPSSALNISLKKTSPVKTFHVCAFDALYY